MIRFLYLHGFASGPLSRKAQFFRERLAESDISLESPDLAEGDFRNLTLTGQLNVIERTARNEPAFLIGSSMGGYLAALYAARHPEVRGLLLLAPAFDFYQLWTSTMAADDLEQWKHTGEVPVFHYAAGRQLPIGYQLLEDSQQYEAFPAFTQPCLIFHGSHDSVVPAAYSKRLTVERPNVELVTLQSGHELTDVLGNIWTHSQPFLLRYARD